MEEVTSATITSVYQKSRTSGDKRPLRALTLVLQNSSDEVRKEAAQGIARANPEIEEGAAIVLAGFEKLLEANRYPFAA